MIMVYRYPPENPVFPCFVIVPTEGGGNAQRQYVVFHIYHYTSGHEAPMIYPFRSYANRETADNQAYDYAISLARQGVLNDQNS